MKKLFALAAIPAMILASGAASADSWSHTQTKAYWTSDAVRVGNVDADTQLDIVIGLKLRNKAELDEYIRRMGTEGDLMFGQSLSHEFVERNYGPLAADVEAVKEHLRNYGFTNIEFVGQLVTAKGTIAQAREAFQTEFATFSKDGKTFFANTTEARVPANLEGIVESVGGLHNHEFMHPMLRVDATPNVATGHNPQDFAAIYGVKSTTTKGTNTAIGIITEGSMTNAIANLKTFESKAGIAEVPVTTEGPGSTDTSGDTEWELDTQDIVGMSGGVKSLTLYDASALTDSALNTMYNLVVSDNKVKAINVSLGGCELSEKSSGGEATADAIFQKAVAQGQTFFVSSGDSGVAECGRRKTGQSYPAVSPYVTAVGGTTLNTTSAGAYSSETVWSGTGGGPSATEAEPSWQKPVTLIKNVRGVADWAFDANPSTGAKIWTSSTRQSQVGGTSLSAPLATGTWARSESAHNNSLGFAAPLIYTMAEGSTYSATFHDVKSGNNGTGGYSAGTGWDFPTGWGSANVDAFVSGI